MGPSTITMVSWQAPPFFLDQPSTTCTPFTSQSELIHQNGSSGSIKEETAEMEVTSNGRTHNDSGSSSCEYYLWTPAAATAAAWVMTHDYWGVHQLLPGPSSTHTVFVSCYCSFTIGCHCNICLILSLPRDMLSTYKKLLTQSVFLLVFHYYRWLVKAMCIAGVGAGTVTLSSHLRARSPNKNQQAKHKEIPLRIDSLVYQQLVPPGFHHSLWVCLRRLGISK